MRLLARGKRSSGPDGLHDIQHGLNDGRRFEEVNLVTGTCDDRMTVVRGKTRQRHMRRFAVSVFLVASSQDDSRTRTEGLRSAGTRRE